MAISAEDKKDIDQLRSVKVGANHLADIAEMMVQKKGQNPALDSAGRKFTQLASVPDTEKLPLTAVKERTEALTAQVSMRSTLRAIDSQLENPATKTAVINLLERNPAGFEKVLPQIFANPKNTAGLIQQELAAIPAAAPVQSAARPASPAVPAAAPATAKPATAPSKPAQPVVSPSTSPAGQDASPVAAAAAATARPPSPPSAAKAPDTEGEFLDFLEKMKEKNADIVKDFAGFKARIDSNQIPEVSEAFRALTEGHSNAKESKEALNELKKTVESQPQFFANINKAMDKNPGVLTGIAKDAMALGGGPASVLKGVAGYSQFSESSFAQSGFGKMILQFIDGFFGKGGLTGMINGLLGKVGIDFRLGTDGKDLQAQSNNNGAMTRDALKQQGSNPASVTVQDPSGSKQTKTGAQFTADAPAAPERNLQEQRALQETLGARPGA